MSGENKTGKRFFIDERIGCIAVRDSSLMNEDSGNCLERESDGVVWFRMGHHSVRYCEKCHQATGSDWTISDVMRTQAQEECDRLNTRKEKAQ